MAFDGEETPELAMMSRLNWLVIAAILIATPMFQGCWITPSVYTVRLARCSVDWHVNRGIIALACHDVTFHRLSGDNASRAKPGRRQHLRKYSAAQVCRCGARKRRR